MSGDFAGTAVSLAKAVRAADQAGAGAERLAAGKRVFYLLHDLHTSLRHAEVADLQRNNAQAGARDALEAMIACRGLTLTGPYRGLLCGCLVRLFVFLATDLHHERWLLPRARVALVTLVPRSTSAPS